MHSSSLGIDMAKFIPSKCLVTPKGIGNPFDNAN